MQETLAEAIDQLSTTDRGLHFTSGKETQSYFNFPQLRERVINLARKLPNVGSKRGNTIILMFADQADFVQGFLAASRAGLIVVPVPPPNFTENREQYAIRVERIRRIVNAELILASDSLAALFRPLLSKVQLVSLTELNSYEEQGELPKIQSSDLALIQFTSGSTAAPKGVSLVHRQLIANASAIKQALDVDPTRDQGVSWLPMHHDMGLIGFLITPIISQTSVWYLPPIEFARRPQRWLELISETKSTISFAPNFGYDLVSRRVRETEIEKWDLSEWRVAGCGGEPVIPSVLNKFAETLAAAKFNRKAFAPSYGLAESTLAVTMSSLNQGMRTHELSDDEQSSRKLVSSGRAVANTEIRIASDSGTTLPEGVEGEIQVRGPGVASGFWNENGIDKACNCDGWLKTGDLGVLIKGELYVSGRIKELVALNGCKYHPHDIEECVLDVEGVKRGKVVAFGRPAEASEQLVLMIETKLPDKAEDLKRKLRTCVRERLGLNVADVVAVGNGVISRTTSGKIQRRAMRARYLAESL